MALGLTLGLVLVSGLAAGLAGCGSASSRGRGRLSAGRLLVYSSLPLIGPSAQSGRAVLAGERLALAAVHGRIGRYAIVLRSLDDATRASDGSSAGQTSANATLAARDPRTIAYLGDLNSGETAVSLPLLNHAGIPQISPLSTALGLTRGGPGAAPGEPEKYYPSHTHTFARVVPSDAVQSAVQVDMQRAAGCARMYVISDDEVEGGDAANTYEVSAQRAGLHMLGTAQFEPAMHGYASLVATLRRLQPDCVLVSALLQSHAVAVTDAVGRALPRARLFITAPLAEPAFVDPALGGISEQLDPRVELTAPTLGRDDYPPAGRRLYTRFSRRDGAGASQAIWGDAAMQLLLAAIRRASVGPGDITRSRVLAAIFATRRLPTALGTFSIEPSGDTTLRRFGVYRVRDGRLVFWRAVRG